MGIKKDKDLAAETELRNRAEEQLLVQPPKKVMPQSKDEMQRLLHELQVHQIELEMQNSELRHSRYETETALEKYSDLYEFAPVGYFTLDRNALIRAVNLAGACLIGIDRSRLINRRFWPFVSTEDRPFFSDFLDKVFASRHAESCEIKLTAEGSSLFYLQIEAVAFGPGEECHVAAIDITGRRLAEEELANKRVELEELNNSLVARIAKDVDELRQMDQMLILQDRRAAMGEMISNIAHQWRQPLNVLGLYLQELPLTYDTDMFDRKYLENSVAKSMKLIMHMSRTIDDFRNFFRADKKKVSFSVNDVIEKTLSLVEGSFKEQKISIACHSEGVLKINGYPNEYAQVLLNILMNARDALVDGNIDEARISLRTFNDENRSVVTITDNAGGIDNKIIDRIFDPYFTTKGADKGTGIGLFMS
ncbi:MAG: PAS domain S-box protein, partial [Desulfobulbaceae bacterium]|nr:PAS domain S-box protein [Desulfobulbaceae bacterium]